METKTTTASVRIALSHNYSTFEVTMNLDNQNGIDKSDIENARKECQELAQAAVNEYRATPGLNAKQELQRVENKVKEIKKMMEKEPEKVDPKAVEEIQKLPEYSSKKSK